MLARTLQFLITLQQTKVNPEKKHYLGHKGKNKFEEGVVLEMNSGNLD